MYLQGPEHYRNVSSPASELGTNAYRHTTCIGTEPQDVGSPSQAEYETLNEILDHISLRQRYSAEKPF